MSAISATSRTCKTMADGTLRLTVDIEPNSAQAAFQLFGMPDVPIALARLTQEAAIQSAQAETIAEAKPKGGALAKLAGQWCNETSFADWIESRSKYWPVGLDAKYRDVGHMGDADYCRIFILAVCNIRSRAEIDHDQIAAEKFHRLIRIPYADYLREAA